MRHNGVINMLPYNYIFLFTESAFPEQNNPQTMQYPQNKHSDSIIIPISIQKGGCFQQNEQVRKSRARFPKIGYLRNASRWRTGQAFQLSTCFVGHCLRLKIERIDIKKCIGNVIQSRKNTQADIQTLAYVHTTFLVSTSHFITP
jgi:hypothetical protein